MKAQLYKGYMKAQCSDKICYIITST